MSKSSVLPLLEWVGVFFKMIGLVTLVGLLLLMVAYGPKLRDRIARVNTRMDAALRSLDLRAGRYQLAVTVDRDHRANIWRLDTVTGEVTLCAALVQYSSIEPACKAVQS